jgi:diguanylate cyclase (GGDEF)-like protein/PAS domain S-box-containing protein
LLALCIGVSLLAGYSYVYHGPTGQISAAQELAFGLLSAGIAFLLLKRESAQEARPDDLAPPSSLFNNAKDVLFSYRSLPSPRLEYLSPSITFITGYQPHEFLVDPTLGAEIIHPDDRAVHGGLNIFNIPRTHPFNVRLIKKTGETFWAELHTWPLLDNDGRPVGVQGVIRDITGRKSHEEMLRKSDHRLQLALHAANMALWHWDVLSKEMKWSGALHLMLETDPTEVQETFDYILDRVYSEDLAGVRAKLDDALYFDQPFKIEFRVLTHLRNLRWFAIDGEVLRDTEDRPISMTGNLIDITERKQYEEELSKTLRMLQESEERYRVATSGANDGIWDWNLKTNQVYYSNRWLEMIGVTDPAAFDDTPQAWVKRIHPDDAEAFAAAFTAHLAGETEHFEAEYRIVCKDQRYRWMLCRGLVLRDAEGNPTRLAGSQTDITSKKAISQRLAWDASHDPLTRLANRALFMRRLDRSLRTMKADPTRDFAVLFLDLDRFKVINDSLGHSAGDDLLVAIARRLEVVLRPNDTFSRLGGDEFTILLDDVKGIENAVAIAHRLQQELLRPFTICNQEVFVTASIGLTYSGSGYERADDIMRDADAAMYNAKEQGKDRLVMFDPQVHQKAMATLMLHSDLRRAIENEEFVLFYQPIFSLHDEGVYGYEALIRWQHPERGLVSPEEFIQYAESTGLIIPISDWALREACRQVTAWNKISSKRLTVSVNVSPIHFTTGKLIDRIGEILAETGAEPEFLRLEITESKMLKYDAQLLHQIEQLQKMRVRLQIDDFGTGYSCLAYLQRYPIEALKIDRVFIEDIDTTAEQKAIVRTISQLGEALGIAVIAEGVESAAQLNVLKNTKCQYAQGYFFSKPVEAAEITAILQQTEIGLAATSA